MNKKSYKLYKLLHLCEIRSGVPLQRVTRIEEGEEKRRITVLTPKSMSNGYIEDSELNEETVGPVKDEYLTREGDVVVKLSTPYDSVYIDKNHEGLLITSFSMVLRSRSTNVDMQFLAMLLNSTYINQTLQAKSTSESSVKLLRKHDLIELQVPLVSIGKQKALAALSQKVGERRKHYEQLAKLDSELLDSQLMKVVWGE